MAPWNWFKPSSKIFYWPFQGGTSMFFLSCVCYAFVSVCLYVPCGHLLGGGWPFGSRLWCPAVGCHFPIDSLSQVWYLIVSIPDLCTLTYFENNWDALFIKQKYTQTHTMNMLHSVHHNIYGITVNKTTLSPLGTKRYITSGGITPCAYGCSQYHQEQWSVLL